MNNLFMVYMLDFSRNLLYMLLVDSS